MPCKLRTRENSRIVITSEVDRGMQDRGYYEKDTKYPSKLDIVRSKMRQLDDERYPEYPPATVPTRSCVDPFRTRPPDYRDYDRERRNYDEEKKRYYEQQRTSRSFDVQREGYDDERNCRRTARSDTNRLKRYDERDKRYDDAPKYYDEKPGKYYDDKPVEPRPRNEVSSKDRRWKRHVERCDRVSMASREDEYRERERERDRYSERERDSVMSVADGDTSTISGRSNYLKVVKVSVA